ncbi:MAG: glycosyltransferase [Caulobacteraceae bacterium]|nr:glycosyltransferase [Caulobacteraceae bacterium]
MIPTIGLCMIVKDEAKVIVRCLESVRPITDYVLIVDTGSSDDTIGVIERHLAQQGLAGEVARCDWVDFAYNRTFALARLREKADIDYCLMIDADEVLQYADDFDPAAFKAGLSHDLYDITTRYGGVNYPRPQLFRNRLDFSFRGVLHEFLERPEGELTRGPARGLWNVPTPDGARSQNPRKFDDDAEMLRRVLAAGVDEPWLEARYQFYLAQSLRDAGRPAEALEAYAVRAAQGFTADEVFYSHFQVGRLAERLGRPAGEIVTAYLDAFQASPNRAEPLHALASYYRRQDKLRLAFEFARIGRALPKPTWGFCVENWIYDYAMQDEYGVAAYWAGAYAECLEACDQLLANPALPEADRPRIEANRAFAVTKLAEQAAG